MDLNLLRQPDFFRALFALDQDIASKTRKCGCLYCGNPILHVANYPRKHRGLLHDPPESFGIRFSFCCSREGCRKRATPASVRFLGRRVYLGIAVVLLSALCNGASPQTVGKLTGTIGVDRKTLKRWLVWWKTAFVASPFWTSRKERFNRTFDAEEGIRPIVDCFFGTPKERLIRFLSFVSPLAGGFVPDARYSMANPFYAEDGL